MLVRSRKQAVQPSKQQNKIVTVKGASRGPVQFAPLSMSTMFTNNPPRSLPGKEGGIRFQHTEMIQAFTGGSAYSVNSGSINPGLQVMFPWLSFLALVHESYIFHKLRFFTISLQPATQSGEVMMLIDYDAADDAPSSAYELLNGSGARSIGSWMSLDMPAYGKDENTLGKRRYVRGGSLSSNLDIKTYDLGVLHLAFQGLASTVSAARLFVEYDVELITPQFSLSTLSGVFSRRILGAGSVSKTSLYGTAATLQGGLPVTASGNTLTFQKPGQYLLESSVEGTGISDAGSPTVSGTATSSNIIGTLANAAGTSGLYSQIVNVLNANETVVQDWSAVATTITGATTRLAAYLYSLA